MSKEHTAAIDMLHSLATMGLLDGVRSSRFASFASITINPALGERVIAHAKGFLDKFAKNDAHVRDKFFNDVMSVDDNGLLNGLDNRIKVTLDPSVDMTVAVGYCKHGNFMGAVNLAAPAEPAADEGFDGLPSEIVDMLEKLGIKPGDGTVKVIRL